MLDLICSYAPVCVTRDYVSALELNGLFEVVDRQGLKVVASAAAVQRLGVRIQFVTNDNYGHIDPGKLRQTCVEGACVAFRMSCDNLTCSWQVGPMPSQGETKLEQVILAASSAEAMERARANVFVSFASVGSPQKISLTQLGAGDPARPGRYEAPHIEGDQRLPLDTLPGR